MVSKTTTKTHKDNPLVASYDTQGCGGLVILFSPRQDTGYFFSFLKQFLEPALAIRFFDFEQG